MSIDFHSFTLTSNLHACRSKRTRIMIRKIKDESFSPIQSFKKTTGGIFPSKVRSTDTFTTRIVIFKICEFGVYPPMARAYVKYQGR